MKYEIGSKIREYREKEKFTQKEFAAKIGVSNSRVSNWELGINRPDVNLLATICNVLDVSADELLDIHLNEKAYSKMEKEIIAKYREKPEVQEAVNILLGIEAKNKGY